MITHNVGHQTNRKFAETDLQYQATNPGVERIANTVGAGLPDHSKRGFMRGIVTNEYKFARYFSATDHHTPRSIKQLRLRNDLELFDLRAAPGESTNQAAVPNPPQETLLAMNARLNDLIEREVVASDNRRGMPRRAFHWYGPETIEIAS